MHGSALDGDLLSVGRILRQGCSQVLHEGAGAGGIPTTLPRSLGKLCTFVAMQAVSIQLLPLKAITVSPTMPQYGSTARPDATSHSPRYPHTCSVSPISSTTLRGPLPPSLPLQAMTLYMAFGRSLHTTGCDRCSCRCA